MRNINIIFCFLGTLILSFQTNAQTLENGIWKLESSIVIYNGDSTSFYELNTPNNIYDLSKISYNFKNDGSYEGVSVDGSQFQGTWSLNGSSIEIDNIKGDFASLNQTSFQISTPFTIIDTLGNTFEAESILRFYDSTTTDIKNVNNDYLIIASPNPFKSELTIDIKDLSSPIIEITILNSLGEIIYSANYSELILDNKISINTSNFEKGYYVLSIKGERWLINKKAIK